MKKVLVGGTFNVVHCGHEFFLKKAKSLGDYLVVVVANDKTVLKKKGFLISTAKERKKSVESLKFVDKVVIGHESDFMKVVKKEKPDIITLGYNQDIDEKILKNKIKEMGLKCKIIRIHSRLKGYSTSKILKRITDSV